MSSLSYFIMENPKSQFPFEVLSRVEKSVPNMYTGGRAPRVFENFVSAHITKEEAEKRISQLEKLTLD